VNLDTLASPYPDYSDEDIRNRVLYVEASRGCPFKCEFCLSSLDKTAVPFQLDEFLVQLDTLLERGATQFKFVDRTFNLKVETSCAILDFFLNKMAAGKKNLFLHFELIPDRLPEAIKTRLVDFPDGSLQFEIGIQTFNVDVQKRISRKQNHEKTVANLTWLREHTGAHIHADLIFGLPGETLISFERGFNELVALGPQEIQLGILKRLRGTPITRHTIEFNMLYMDEPPYRILANRDIDFPTMQRMIRFARYWDLIANSGRFPNTLPVLLDNNPFARFLQITNWLFNETGQTHAIALPRLIGLLHSCLINEFDADPLLTTTLLHQDFEHNKLKGRPPFAIAEHATGPVEQSTYAHGTLAPTNQRSTTPKRQSRHLTG